MLSHRQPKGLKIHSAKDLAISAADFIFEKTGKFRDIYQVGPPIGVGAFGEVRRCISKRTGLQRAVKIIRKDALDSRELKRFFEEIEIMKDLDHPNVIKLYEYYQDNKRIYLVTE